MEVAKEWTGSMTNLASSVATVARELKQQQQRRRAARLERQLAEVQEGLQVPHSELVIIESVLQDVVWDAADAIPEVVEEARRACVQRYGQ